LKRIDRRLLVSKSPLYRPEYEHDNCGVGFVAHVEGKASHEIIRQGIEVLVNLTHRGAVADDPDTGDGAGILIQLCDRFFRKKCSEMSIDLPDPGKYGVGMVLGASLVVRAIHQGRQAAKGIDKFLMGETNLT